MWILTVSTEQIIGKNYVVVIFKSFNSFPSLVNSDWLWKGQPKISKLFVKILVTNDGKNNRYDEYLPLLYFYDSYLVPSDEWKKLTEPSGKFTVRDSKYDVLFIGKFKCFLTDKLYLFS